MTTAVKAEVVWAERVRAWRASGETAERFASGAGYAAGTLRWWSSRLGRREAPRFLQLVPKDAVRDPEVVVEVGGARLRVRAGFDASLLGAVVAALGGAR